MASQEEDNKLECISNVNKEQERYYLTVYKKYDSILNDKSENFEKKVTSLIEVWGSISELNLSQFDIRYVIQIIDWAKLHALNIVLTGEWRNTKESCRNNLLESIENAQTSLASVNDAFSSRCHKLADVVKKPWENPVLKTLIQEKDVEIGSKEIEFFCVETAYLVSVRLKKLCENHCEDLALNLVTNFLKYKKLAAEKNFNLNATETQLWFIFDIYIALLYKFQDKPKIVEQFEELKLEEGLLLIKRFAKKRVKISKIWRNCQKIAIFGSRFFMSRTLLKYTENYKAFLIELLKTYLTLSNNETLLQEFVVSVRNITNLADAASLCIICDFIHREAADKLRVFAVEMYIRALTTDMNELERLKHVNEDDKVKSTTSRLSKTFTNLADLLDDHVKVARECVLTAFSLEPTKDRLKKIENLAKRSGFPVLDTGQEWKCRLHPPVLPTDDLAWVCPECGEWMCKPELTAPLQMNMALHEALQESVLGISEALCDDLVVCLSNPRYQILSWLLSWGDLYRLCILYLNDPEKTKNFVTELKFVDVDYSMFEHIKREPVDEFTGIEKGYEQYLDLDFVSDEETSSVSEDSMSLEKVGLGSDGAGEPYMSLPQPKSDPVTLKSLRMFRPNLKRKKDDSDDPMVDKKTAVQLTALTSSASSLGSYLTSSQYNPQSEYSTNTPLKMYINSHTMKRAPPSSVSLPNATRQNTTINASQVSPANNFTQRSNIDQVNSRIQQSSFSNTVHLACYSAKPPHVRKTANLSMSANTILQPDSSVFNATNLSNASSTSYVSKIIKSNLSYGVPKITVSNSFYSSTLSNETVTNSQNFGRSSNVTSEKNTSPHQRSLASANVSSQKSLNQQDASHNFTFQQNTSQQVANNTVPDLDALLNEIDTNNKYETDPKNGVAATLLQLGGQVAKNQKQLIQVPHQSSLNQTPTKLPQETSLPNGITEECKTRLSNKPDRSSLLGEILDQAMEPPRKLQKLTRDSNNPDKVTSHGRATSNIMELQVKIPKLNLEKFSKSDQLSQNGKILDKTELTPQTQNLPRTIQASSLIKTTKVPTVLTKSLPKRLALSKTQRPSEMCRRELSVPLAQCNPLLFSKQEHSTHLQDKSPSQIEIPAIQTCCQPNATVGQEFLTLPCQKEPSSIHQEQLQKATIHSAAQLRRVPEPQPQLNEVLNRETYLAPRQLEPVIILERARTIISQALPQQHKDSKCLPKEPVSKPHSASINLVKNQECPETTNTSLSLKAGTKRPLKQSSQFTGRELVSQKKLQATCTLADFPKTITPTTMDCDKDKKVQIYNQKTDIERTEVEDVNSSTAEGNNNQLISQVSSEECIYNKAVSQRDRFLIQRPLTNYSGDLVKCKRTKKRIKELTTGKIKTSIGHVSKQQRIKIYRKSLYEERKGIVSIIKDSLASDTINIENETNVEVEGNPENTYCNSNNNDIIAFTENTNETSNKTLKVNYQGKSGDTLVDVNRKMDCDKTEKNVQINIEPKKTASSESKCVETKESLKVATKLNTKEQEVKIEMHKQDINQKNIVIEAEKTTASKENMTASDFKPLGTYKPYNGKHRKLVLHNIKAVEEFENIWTGKNNNIDLPMALEEPAIDEVDVNIQNIDLTMASEESATDEMDVNIQNIDLTMTSEESATDEMDVNIQTIDLTTTSKEPAIDEVDLNIKNIDLTMASEESATEEMDVNIQNVDLTTTSEEPAIDEVDVNSQNIDLAMAWEEPAIDKVDVNIRNIDLTKALEEPAIVEVDINIQNVDLAKTSEEPAINEVDVNNQNIDLTTAWEEPAIDDVAVNIQISENNIEADRSNRDDVTIQLDVFSTVNDVKENIRLCSSETHYLESLFLEYNCHNSFKGEVEITSGEPFQCVEYRLNYCGGPSKRLVQRDNHLAKRRTSPAIRCPSEYFVSCQPSPERSLTEEYLLDTLPVRRLCFEQFERRQNSPARQCSSNRLARREISPARHRSSVQFVRREMSPSPDRGRCPSKKHISRRDTWPEKTLPIVLLENCRPSLEKEPCLEHLANRETSLGRTCSSDHLAEPECSPTRQQASPTRRQTSEHLSRQQASEIPEISDTKQGPSDQLPRCNTPPARQHLARRKILPARYHISPKKQHPAKNLTERKTSPTRLHSKHLARRKRLPASYQHSPKKQHISANFAGHKTSPTKLHTRHLARRKILPARYRSSPIKQSISENSAGHKTSAAKQQTSEHSARPKTSPARTQTLEHLAKPKNSDISQCSENLKGNSSSSQLHTSEALAGRKVSPTRRNSEHLVRCKMLPARYRTSPKKQNTSGLVGQQISNNLARRKTSTAMHRTAEGLALPNEASSMRPPASEHSSCDTSERQLTVQLTKQQELFNKHLDYRSASVSPSIPRSKIQIILEDVFDEYCTKFRDRQSASETDKENISDRTADSDSSEDSDNVNISSDTQNVENQCAEDHTIKKYSNTHRRQHDVPCFKVDQEKFPNESADFEAKELSVLLQRLPSNITNRIKLGNRKLLERNPETASILLLQERLRERIKKKANAPICVLYNKDVNIKNPLNQKLLNKKKIKHKHALSKSVALPTCSILKKKSSKEYRKHKKHVHFNPKAQVFFIDLPVEETTSAKSLLSNVPGLHDFSEVRPRNTEQVVNVVQVSGGRSSTVTNQNTQTSTQVTPHIQRIGQPKPEPKSDRSEEKPEPSSSATTSRESLKPTTQAATLTFGGQIKAGQKSSGTSRQTPHINILSQQILKQPTLPRPCTHQHKQLWNPPPPRPNEVCKTATVKADPEDNVEVQANKPTNTNVKIVTSTTQACGTAATAPSSSQGGTILQFICKTSSLPKFQQAFGKTVYQTNSSSEGAAAEATAAPTSENLTPTATVLDTKKITTKAVPVNVQPITGNVIFRGQVPVGQTVSLIPPGSSTRQLFRITGSTHEQISLVKETVIQNKMSALLAAALQGKPKITEQNGELVEEYSATRITLCRPGTVPPNATRIVKPVQLQIPANVIRAPQPNVSSTTLEQLREFDMVYKQVKERSSNPAQPEATTQISQDSPQQQRISFTYVNQVQKYTQLSPVVVVSSYSPLQQTVSPALTVTSQSGTGTCLTQVSTVAVPKVTVKTSKGKNIKSSATKTSPTAVPTIPKPQQKPQEDEHTTQRIFDILAEYAEQLRNSPDLNNKPAPRRRSNPPTNPSSSTSGSSSSKKKKKKSGSSTTSNMVETDNEDLTMGSEDSSGGNIVQLSMTDEEQSQSASITPPETNLEPATSNTPTSRPLIVTDTSNQARNVIIADSSVGDALKMPNTTLIMPGSYIMPVSVVKGGQQIAVVSGGSKILTTVPARSGQNMLLFQSFVNQNKKGGISTVKYSTIQPFSGISSQNVARVSPQPPVMLPSNSLATVALGQPITLKKLDDSERGTNTEVLLTISQPRETVKVEQSPEIPQPDSSTNLSNEAIEVKIEEGSQSDSSSNEVFNAIQKTNSVATSVIASVVKKEHEEQSDNSTDVDTSIIKAEEPVKQVQRIGSVLVNASTSNGPMLSHTNTRYRKAPESVQSSTAPTKEFNHNVAKVPPPGTKIFKNNAVYYAIRTKKAVGKKIDSEMQKQAAMEREIRLQKSLSEECEDLGVDEPSTSDLFPEADLLFDSNHSPSYDHTGQRIQVAEVKAKASMNLFSDDENSGPMRNDLFDYVEYHPAQAGVDQMNGNNASNESVSSCDDTTLLPNCGTMSEVTLNSPISPEYTDNIHAVNKYKYKYTNRKRGEKVVKSHAENWSEVTSTEDATEDDTPIAIQEESVIDESEIEPVVEEKEFQLKCLVHGSTDTRGSRKNIKKACSCFNGSKSPSSSTVKRRGSSPKCQMPTPSKKPLLSKKR